MIGLVRAGSDSEHSAVYRRSTSRPHEAVMFALVMLSMFAVAACDLSNLDLLLDRMDGASSPQPPGSSEVVTTPEPMHRVRHSHLLHELKEEYDEEEDEEEDEEPQADNYQRSPYTTSVGKLNWSDFYSSRKNSGRIYSSVKSNSLDPKEQSEVRSHIKLMSTETCRVPKPKIIRVSDHYPSMATYYPSCTRLHVCAEDTGCCGPTQKCAPKGTSKVEMYFYVTSMEMSALGGHHPVKTYKIQKLVFHNHTDCACQDRMDEMPRDTFFKTGLDTNKITNHPTPYRCKCPSEYTVRNLANGSCSCDCFDKQRDCTKYKKGKENFNLHDRICIESGKCTVPSCDFGVFNRRLGRCPRKHEKFRSWPRYKA